MITSLMTIPDGWDRSSEFMETLYSSGTTRLERIISVGHRTPEGTWYDQVSDEWVALIQGVARIQFADGNVSELRDGDSVLIPSHQRHRVTYTSTDPPCIWLALHVHRFPL